MTKTKQLTIEIKTCDDCPHVYKGPDYSTDGFDRGEDWFCGAMNKRKLAGFVERPREYPTPPDWCPLPKPGEEIENRNRIEELENELVKDEAHISKLCQNIKTLEARCKEGQEFWEQLQNAKKHIIDLELKLSSTEGLLNRTELVLDAVSAVDQAQHMMLAAADIMRKNGRNHLESNCSPPCYFCAAAKEYDKAKSEVKKIKKKFSD